MRDVPDLPPAAAATGLLALFEAQRAELLRFLRARCGDSGEAEDLIQELWLKLSGARAGPVANARAGPIANGRAYLFRMANNLVLDAHRARQRAMARDRGWLAGRGHGDAPPELQADPAPDAQDRMVAAEEAAALASALAALPPGAERALRLHRFEGHGQSEVARIMGISRSGVEKHLAVAMKHLRKILLERGALNCGSFATAASGKEGDKQAGGQGQAEQRQTEPGA